MTPGDIYITKHAMERFQTRWHAEDAPGDWQQALRALLHQATEEDIGSGRVKRLLNNSLRPARYFTTGNWRFVTDEDATRLLTCERAYIQNNGRRTTSPKERLRLSRERKLSKKKAP